jgi:hypothetical protein
MSPEELITMGVSPADADTSAEELHVRWERARERRRQANLDCSMEGRGYFLNEPLGHVATRQVADTPETL